MSDEPGAKAGNPGAGTAEPEAKGGSSTPPNAGSDQKFQELSQERDTLKRQYSASSEEALRLKKENERLTQELTKSSKPQSKVDNDDTFEAIAKEKGTVNAIRDVVREVLNPLATKVETLFESEAAKLLDSFKSKHPGFSQVVEKFNAELNRLKVAYPDVHEAMDIAYKIVGGLEADASGDSAKKAEQEKANLVTESEKEKQRLAGTAGDSGADKKAAPGSPVAELEEKLKALQYKATVYSVQGKTSMELFAQIETLKQEIARKRSS